MNTIHKVQDLEQAHGVTWGQLAGMGPGLLGLWGRAGGAGSGCGGGEEVGGVSAPFRGAVAELVGFRGLYSGCPVLGSVGAYLVVYWRLREAVSGLLPRPAT